MQKRREICTEQPEPCTLDFYAVGIPAACLLGAILAALVELL